MWNLRSLAERIFRPFVFVRHLPAAFRGVPVVVSPSAGLKFLATPMDKIDPQLFAFVREFVKPGSVIWDVGANVGLLSVAAAGIAGKSGAVYAFEPDTWLVRLLRRTATLQPLTSAPIDVLPVAVASEVALRTFDIAQRSRQTSHLEGYGTSQSGGTRERQTVMTITLDWALAQIRMPDVIKIDVEGAELEVLEGAVELFKTARPVVLCEVGATVAQEVSDFFHARNYTLYNSEASAETRVPLQTAAWNTLAVPLSIASSEAGGTTNVNNEK